MSTAREGVQSVNLSVAVGVPIMSLSCQESWAGSPEYEPFCHRGRSTLDEPI